MRREERAMYKRLELHNHTTESDSSLSCKELLEIMEADRADAFAITDHNTISGHSIIKKLLDSGDYKIKCIYGMEYTTYYGHILCLNLPVYVPWDSIDFFKPELLFNAARAKGALVGIAHPFSFGAPFAKGCRFEMKVKDFSAVDFIEVFNNPEPLHEVNEKGLIWWEELILDGKRLAATCGMDLHGHWDMGNQYATFIEGEEDGDVEAELSHAIKDGKTWVSKGMLLICDLKKDSKSLKLSLFDSKKPGFLRPENGRYIVSLRGKNGLITKEISENEEVILSLDKLKGEDIIIPKLYIKDTDIENLVCISPVVRI